MDEEEWRDIAGYPGYEVSDRGGARSWKGMGPSGGGGLDSPRPLTPRKHTKGYLRINARHELGKIRDVYIHRAVLTAFVGECPDGYEADHINCDRTDNRLANLQWVPVVRNRKLVKERGRQVYGSAHGLTKFDEKDVPVIRQRLANGESQSLVAKSYGVSQTAISRLARGETWKEVA